MKTGFFFGLVMIGCYGMPVMVCAQKEPPLAIEQSAEVYLEDYSDEFQEHFFEGLKQKGIQNYDRAVTSFLECQNIEPANEVVANELAKAYLLDKKFLEAQVAAVKALNAQPENYWYAVTLVQIVAASKVPIEGIKKDIPYNNELLRKHLAEIYFKRRNYETAKNVLKGIANAKNYIGLENKIADAIKEKQLKAHPNNKEARLPKTEVHQTSKTSEVTTYKTTLEALLKENVNSKKIVTVANEAIERYPAQPYFYYASGYGLNLRNDSKEALSFLEMALDYVIDDVSLQNKIYKELAKAYLALNQPEKATRYTKKIIPEN